MENAKLMDFMNSLRIIHLGLSLFFVTPVIGQSTAPADLGTAKPGDLVQLDPSIDLRQIPVLQLTITDGKGPQFLFSDKPEYFRSGNGIAMQEVVQPGKVRLYLYHVPTPDDRTHAISAVIENLGHGTLTLRMHRNTLQPPGGDYHKIGKTSLFEYFNDSPKSDVLSVPPGGRAVLDPNLDKLKLKRDMLVHGIYEFEIDQPVKVTTFQRDPDQDSLKIVDSLEKLPQVLPGFNPSGAGRGLFPRSDVDVASEKVIDTADGMRQMVVADGKTDPWIVGTDSISGDKQQINKGNYGVMYRATLRYRSSDGRAMAVVLTNGRADGKWCTYAAAAMKVNDGRHPGGAVMLPTGQTRFEGLPQAVMIQSYPPANPGGTGTIEFIYSPPGASCLPTPILLIPIDR